MMTKKKGRNRETQAAGRHLSIVLLMVMGMILPPMATQTAAQTFITSPEELTSGYYRVYSQAYNTTMAMSESETGSDNVYVDTPDDSDFRQVWWIEVTTSGTTKTATFQNAVSQRYINRSGSNIHTHPSALAFTVGLTELGFTFVNTGGNGGGFHHQQSGHDVVSYSISADASKWQLSKVTVDENDPVLTTQRENYTNFATLVNNKAAISTALATFFTDGSCSELISEYQEYTDEALTTAMSTAGIPETAITMAKKVKNGTWETYDANWDHNERTFRIASYAPVGKASRWKSLIHVSYDLSPNSDPTGIYVDAGDILTVYVSAIPDGQSVVLRNVPRYSATGDGYTLSAGFNILKMQSQGCLFVDYEVDNTTNGDAPFTPLSSYPDVTIQIEGGKVNGAFSITRGDTNEDWAYMKQYLFQHYDYLQLRCRNQLFNMNKELVMTYCPEKMVEMLGQWDFILDMEHDIMGLDEFKGYFNTPLMAVSFTSSNHMYASTYGTYYNENTLADVMSYENLFAGGSLWGPAHEIGHIHQAAINIIGQSEVSNNVFSNIAVYLNGHLTCRASNIATTFQNMADSVYWQDRGIWERTHLYFQLYQFFHIQGYKTDFYQKFFRALRANPTRRVQNVLVDATDDYLKFYKTACKVSGYDLTEFFQAYGFFVVPELTTYEIGGNNVPAFWVGDYGNYYLNVTKGMIDATIDEVKNMDLPKANIIFIEDRITAPDATYAGAPDGAKKEPFSNEEVNAIGKGDVGQYTDFDKDVSASGYTVLYNENYQGALNVIIGHNGASGAVGFKVYDSEGHLVYLSNTYNFTVPKAIYTRIKDAGFSIVAAGADGTDMVMAAPTDYVEWVVKDDDGNVLKTHFQLTTAGQTITAYPDEIKAPFVTLPDLAPFTYTSGMDKEIEVTATMTTPFYASTATQGYYYNFRVRNGYLCQKVSEGVSEPGLTKTGESNLTNDAYRWAFYGNPYHGYRIKNLATGQWLCAGTNYTSNGGLPTLSSSNPTTWDINYFNSDANNTGQFQLAVSGTARYLNDYGGNGTKIAFYYNPSTMSVANELSITMPVVTINAVSHLSSFSYPSPLTVPDDVNIFIVTGTNDNTIAAQWLNTKVIPANTGVLLYSNSGGAKTMSLGAWVDDETGALYNGNLLSNTATAPHTVTAAQDIFALKAGQAAFAKVKTDVTIPLYKAHLEIPSPGEARLFSIDFGQAATVITDIPLLKTDDDATVNSTYGYGISGMRAGKGYKGIVIRHGIKTVQR